MNAFTYYAISEMYQIRTMCSRLWRAWLQCKPETSEHNVTTYIVHTANFKYKPPYTAII